MPTTPRITPNTFHAAPHAPARRALLAGALALALPGLPGVRPARAAAPRLPFSGRSPLATAPAFS